ncbi:MAG: hypothetical protein HQL80_03535 [Magnetococcales bacterium]|nr:hypothetical protein [Magnetococcales bacterium]
MPVAFVGAAVGYAVSNMVVGETLITALVGTGLALDVALAEAAFLGNVAGLLASGATMMIGHAIVGGQTPTVDQNVAQGILLNEQSSVAAIPVIYGERRVGGNLVMPPTVSGENKQFLNLVLVLAEGPIHSVDTVYVDDKPTLWSGTQPLDGVEQLANVAKIFRHMGTVNDSPDQQLMANVPEWKQDFKLSGCAYLYVLLTASREKFHGMPIITSDVRGRTLYDPRDGAVRWSNNPALVIRDYLTHPIYGKGLSVDSIHEESFIEAANQCEERVLADNPFSAPFTVEKKSKYLLFQDSKPPFGTGDGVRLSSTGTLPTPLLSDTTYYVIKQMENSKNGKHYSRISLANSFADALEHIAIELVPTLTPQTIPGYFAVDGNGEPYWVEPTLTHTESYGSGIMTATHQDYARFTCDGVVDTTRTAYDNLKSSATACMGMIIYSGGRYRLVLDQPREATGFDFNPDNITGGWSIMQAGKQNRYNRVSAAIFNAATGWQPDVAIADSPEWRAVDKGLILETKIDLPFTHSIYRATMIAWQVLKQSRYGITAKFTAFQQGLRCEVGDVVSITHAIPGWNQKRFRVMAIQPKSSDDVEITVGEYDPSVYLPGPMPSITLTPGTTLPDPLDVLPPTGLTVSESLYETTGSAGVKCQAMIVWGAATDAFITEYQVEAKERSATDFQKIGAVGGTLFIWRDIAPGKYDFRVRSVNEFGRYSDYITTQTEIFGMTTPPAAMTGLSLSALGGLALLRWSRSPDLDVRIGGHIVFRWSPKMTGATWLESTTIGDAISGDQTTAILPLKEGTYMGMIYDSSGNPATHFASVVSKLATALTYVNASVIRLEPHFIGNGQGVACVDGGLKLDGASLIDAWDEMDSVAELDSVGGLLSTGSFALTQLFDWGGLSRRRLVSSMTVSIINPPGIAVAGANAMLHYAQTDADPASSPDWSDWQRLDSTEVHARAVRFRLLLVSDGISNISVSNLSVTADELP